MISVIIPIFKVEKYLRKCLDSVVDQTYKDIEIILIDDGSPDGCPQICDEYSKIDKRIKVIHKTNGGESSARNAGLEVATGEWISFVDSDDWIDKNAYKEMMSISNKEEFDMLSFAFYRVFDDKYNIIYQYRNDIEITDRKIIKKIQLGALNRMYNPLSNRWESCYLWDKLVRRQTIVDNKLKFREDIKAQEDVIFMFELFSYVKTMKHVNRPLYYYNYNPNSQTTRYTPNRIEIDQKIANTFIQISNEVDLDDEFEDALNSRIVTNMFACIDRSYFHKDNKMMFMDKYKKLSEDLKIPIIHEAFRKVRREKLILPCKIITLKRENNALIMIIVSYLWHVAINIRYGLKTKLSSTQKSKKAIV